MSYIYNIHNFLTVKSDIDLRLNYFRKEEDLSKYNLIIKEVPYKRIDKSKFQQIAHGLYYSKDANEIVSNLNILGLRVSWSIKNLLQENTQFEFSSSYKFISQHVFKVPVSSVYQLEPLVKMIMQMKLLAKKCMFVAGGMVVSKDKGIILTGTYGSGKTTTILSLMDNTDCQFICDDLMIISGDQIYNFPSMIKIRKYNLASVSIHKFLDPAEEYKDRISEKFKGYPDVYFLEQSSSNCIEEVNAEIGVEKLCVINNKIVPYFNERLLSFVPYVEDGYSFLGTQKAQREILLSLFKKTKFYILRSSSTDKSIESIKLHHKLWI